MTGPHEDGQPGRDSHAAVAQPAENERAELLRATHRERHGYSPLSDLDSPELIDHDLWGFPFDDRGARECDEFLEFGRIDVASQIWIRCDRFHNLKIGRSHSNPNGDHIDTA